jgi:hypothetical protein
MLLTVDSDIHDHDQLPQAAAREQYTQDVPHEIFTNLISSPTVPNLVEVHSDDDSESDFWSPGYGVQDPNSSLPTLLPQPTPRTPFKSPTEPISPRPSSVPPHDQGSPVVESHARSQSETIPLRHLRRRPMLVDDLPSLHQLSTLIESRNTGKVGVSARSPVEPVDAFSRLQSPVLRTGRMRALTFPRDDQLHSSERTPFYGSKYTKLDSPRFLLPSYNEDDLVLNYDGSVKAATLSALIERLTLGWLSASMFSCLKSMY